jgi:hypothetical protein
MREWNEIRQKVLVDKVSIRQICRDYRISPDTVAGILENSDPSVYEKKEQPPLPRLGPFLGVIDQILEYDKT